MEQGRTKDLGPECLSPKKIEDPETRKKRKEKKEQPETLRQAGPKRGRTGVGGSRKKKMAPAREKLAGKPEKGKSWGGHTKRRTSNG